MVTASDPALRVLLVDDDLNICRTLSLSLKSLACEVGQAHSVPTALEGLKAVANRPAEAFDLILTDFRMGEKTGSDLIREAKKAYPHTLIAVMTAFASIDNAIEVTREGAFDYLPKPFTRAQLEHLLKKVRLVVGLRRENEALRIGRKTESLFSGMTSVANQRLEEFVRKVAPTEATLLLVGESGTGKTALAQFIHRSSQRADKPFIVVNCTSLAESLLESEIFGHAKGSFTGATHDKPGKFELAHHGTLFLDEIGDLSLGAQSKLLRFLQEKVIERVGSNQTVSVDARVIAATNKNLEEAVAAGIFREDLYYRLNMFECTLVPVRHRKEDLPVFFRRFLREFAAPGFGSGSGWGSEVGALPTVAVLPPSVLEILNRYDWPGNVREIRNVIERLVLLAAGREIAASDLPEKITRVPSAGPTSFANASKSNEMLGTLEAATKLHIERVLQAEPNLDKAAEILGITKVTLWRRRKEYGLP